MTPEERRRIDRVTAAVHYLLKGRIPAPIDCDADPDDEIRQLSAKINTLLRNFSDLRDAVVPLSKGSLDVPIARDNHLASPFKQLQSALKHITWQTRRIAAGDYNQRVDFMGDLSRAFNQMAASLKEVRAQLSAETERYKTLADTKNRYLHIMAHDIRTPLGAILGFTEILLEQSDLPPPARRNIQIIKRHSDYVLALINNTLDMAKLENQKMTIDSRPFSIRRIARDIVEMIRANKKDGVEIVLDLDETLPDRLLGDSHRLEQILMNVMGNALKFTQSGVVRLSVGLTEETNGPRQLILSVSDTGIGIPEERISEIFEPYTQVDSGSGAGYGGTGLGLAICRELVCLMNGTIGVESTVGEGTTFTITLPFTPADAMIDPGGDSYRRRILIVTDDPGLLSVITPLLKREHVRFESCRTTSKALQRLTAAAETKDPFTLVWIDIDMPDRNGFQLARRIRQDARFTNLRLAACSARPHRIGNDAASPARFGFVAAKPISNLALKRILADARQTVEETEAEMLAFLRNKKALVVEDNPVNLFLINAVFNKIGVIMNSAAEGRQGVETALSGGFDVVLMDRHLPDISGVEAVREIRARIDENSLPILAYSAAADSDMEELMSAGANGIVYKPIDYQNLINTLYRVMQLQ